MSITAEQLKNTPVQSARIKDIIDTQLRIIDDKLLASQRTLGINILDHDLPTTFAIPSVQKKDSQILVYSAIISSLVSRGFTVKILFQDNDTTRLYVQWITEFSKEEVDTMREIIIKHKINARILEE